MLVNDEARLTALDGEAAERAAGILVRRGLATPSGPASNSITVECTCATVPPTMPTARNEHLPSCPVYQVAAAYTAGLGAVSDEIARAHEALDSYDVPRTNPTFPGEVELTLVARIDYLVAFREAIRQPPAGIDSGG